MSNNPLKAIWDKYAAEISIALVLFVAWKLRGVFSAIGSAGDSVGAVVAGATASVQQSAKKAQQKAAIKTVAPAATDADVQVFEDDAEALADALGAKSSFWVNSLNTNWQTAYQIAKKYSRLQYRVVGGKIQVIGTRKASLQLPVLYSFYKDATNGRSLQSDLDTVMKFATSDAQAFYAKYVK